MLCRTTCVPSIFPVQRVVSLNMPAQTMLHFMKYFFVPIDWMHSTYEKKMVRRCGIYKETRLIKLLIWTTAAANSY